MNKDMIIEQRNNFFTEKNNVIIGHTAELRIERFLTDHPPHYTQAQTWPSDRLKRKKLDPVPCYTIDNNLLIRVIRLRGSKLNNEHRQAGLSALNEDTTPINPNEIITMIMNIPSIIRKPKGHHIRRIWNMMW
jgi:hypothetical protein